MKTFFQNIDSMGWITVIGFAVTIIALIYSIISNKKAQKESKKMIASILSTFNAILKNEFNRNSIEADLITDEGDRLLEKARLINMEFEQLENEKKLLNSDDPSFKYETAKIDNRQKILYAKLQYYNKKALELKEKALRNNKCIDEIGSYIEILKALSKQL